MDSASSGFESAMICTIDRDGASAAAAGFPPFDGVAVGSSKTYLTGPSVEAAVGGAAVPEAGASATPSGLEGRNAPMSVSREGGCADAIVDDVLAALPISGLGAGTTAVFCGVGAGVAFWSNSATVTTTGAGVGVAAGVGAGVAFWAVSATVAATGA